MRIIKETSQYRLIAKRTNHGNKYIVQVSGRWFWRNVKTFADKDGDYAYICALELYETLIEEI